MYRYYKTKQISEAQEKIIQENNQHIKIIDVSEKTFHNTRKNILEQKALLKNAEQNFEILKKTAKDIKGILFAKENMIKHLSKLLESVKDTLKSIEKLNEIITTRKSKEFLENFITISELENLIASIKLREGTSLPFEINELTFDLMKSLFKFKVTYVNNVIYVSMLIPLKDKNSNDFDLQRIFSVPMIENDTLTYIIPSSDYILISGNGAIFSPVDIENCNKYDEIYYCENIHDIFRKEHACFLNDANETDEKAKVFSHCKFGNVTFDGFKVENLPMKNALLVITNTEKTLTAEKIGTREKGSIKLTKGSHMLRSKKLIKLNFNDAYFKFGGNDFSNVTIEKLFEMHSTNFSKKLNLKYKSINIYQMKAKTDANILNENQNKLMNEYLEVEKIKESYRKNNFFSLDWRFCITSITLGTLIRIFLFKKRCSVEGIDNSILERMCEVNVFMHPFEEESISSSYVWKHHQSQTNSPIEQNTITPHNQHQSIISPNTQSQTNSPIEQNTITPHNQHQSIISPNTQTPIINYYQTFNNYLPPSTSLNPPPYENNN
ncbi:hypothetical protein PVAND_006281 [Polypedilum vanderplanki]|uniref:Uncharacterized protein n=1 Tax=Polypedilum vanderplanki TaxID=319348 RepID=A0A9J6C2P1_POLVA|nr:hypothetical protein PVAND_006281 [Polypedilum vanderplanki]